MRSKDTLAMDTMVDRKTHDVDIEARHASEEIFHDNKYRTQSNYPHHYQLNPTYAVFQEMKQLIGDIRGKRVRESGCGEGWTTVEYAALGGEIDSFDISSVAIHHARSLLQNKNYENTCSFKKMAAEQLDYEDEVFDVVVGFAILHHLDLDKSIPELLRVMKKGAKAYFAEPLGTNPIINLYRRLTPQYRTRDEKPLVLDHFNTYARRFTEFTHHEYYLTALFPLGLVYLKLPMPFIQRINRRCIDLDEWILKRFPSLGKYAWYTIVRLVK